MQGTLATATGLGASASNDLTGLIVEHYGFDAGFATLAGIAGGAFAFNALAMPETRTDSLDPAADRATMGPRDQIRSPAR